MSSGRAVGVVVLAVVVVIMAASCGTRPQVPGSSPTPKPGTPAPATLTRPTPSADMPGSATPRAMGSPSPSPAARPLEMFGLGDSVPAAGNCGCRGFLEQSADFLAPSIGRQVRVRNDAVDGWTTTSVVRALRSGTVRTDLTGGADLVVIEAGANDLPLGQITDPSCQPVQSSPCFRPTLTAVGKALTTAVKLIRSIDSDHDPRIVLMGYWNVSVDGTAGQRRGPAYLKDSNDLTLALNQVVRTVVAQTGTTYLDAYTPLKGPDGDRDPSPYLLPDGDHPNRAGHRLLAEALVERLKRTGAVAAWRAER